MNAISIRIYIFHLPNNYIPINLHFRFLHVKDVDENKCWQDMDADSIEKIIAIQSGATCCSEYKDEMKKQVEKGNCPFTVIDFWFHNSRKDAAAFNMPVFEHTKKKITEFVEDEVHFDFDNDEKFSFNPDKMDNVLKDATLAQPYNNECDPKGEDSHDTFAERFLCSQKTSSPYIMSLFSFYGFDNSAFTSDPDKKDFKLRTQGQIKVNNRDMTERKVQEMHAYLVEKTPTNKKMKNKKKQRKSLDLGFVTQSVYNMLLTIDRVDGFDTRWKTQLDDGTFPKTIKSKLAKLQHMWPVTTAEENTDHFLGNPYARGCEFEEVKEFFHLVFVSHF